MSQFWINRGLAALLCAGVVTATLPQLAQAHHSFSQFDRTRQLVLKGTVYKLQWENPHVWLWVNVPQPDGSVKIWGLEGAAPGEMSRGGTWNKHSLTPGEKITVQVAPLKDGRTGGSMGQVTLADGTVLGGRRDGGGPPPTGGGGPGGAPAGFGGPPGGARPSGAPPS